MFDPQKHRGRIKFAKKTKTKIQGAQSIIPSGRWPKYLIPNTNMFFSNTDLLSVFEIKWHSNHLKEHYIKAFKDIYLVLYL